MFDNLGISGKKKIELEKYYVMNIDFGKGSPLEGLRSGTEEAN
jgi:hypothetical protein